MPMASPLCIVLPCLYKAAEKPHFAHTHPTRAFLHATTSKAPPSCLAYVNGVFSPAKRSSGGSKEILNQKLGIPTPFQQHVHVREYRLSCLSICPCIRLSFKLSLCFTNTLFSTDCVPLADTDCTFLSPLSPFCLWSVLMLLLYHSPLEGLIPCGLFSPSGQSHIHGWQLWATARGV